MITLFLIIFLLPLQVFAIDYSIEEMKIDAKLQENGDVRVTEKQTYTFEGEFNGIIRTLIPKEGTDIVDVTATEDKQAIEIEQDENEYKIHRKGKDETIIIELSYLIKDGVTVYSDVADFSWAFFDTGNESDYEKFIATIHPPSETTDVIAYGDDAAFENEEVEDDGTVKFNFGNVSNGKKGDIRVAYDADLFQAAELKADKSMRESIEADKQELIDQQIAFEKRKTTLNKLAPYITAVIAVVLIICIYFAWQKTQNVIREVNRKYTIPYFVPEETMSLPATITYMNYSLVTPETLSAALMDLVRKKNVEELEENTFKVLNRKTDHPHETLLIYWLFNEIGNEDIFKLEDLETYIENKTNQKTFQTDYSAWQKAVQDEVRDNDLYSKNVKIRLVMMVIGVLTIPVIVYFAIYHLYMYMTVAIISVFLLLGFSAFYKTRTILGVKIKRDWQAFQKKYPKMADEAWEELESDDQRRAFIYGIGIKDKKIDEKNKVLVESFSTDSYMTSPVNMLLIATIISSNFNHAETTSAASSSPSPGTGTGVGGGGGGSGAF